MYADYIDEDGQEQYGITEDYVISYDPLNRMTSYQADGVNATYTYGIDNMRRSKTVNGVTTNYLWDGGNIVAEADGNNAITNRYFRGVGLIASKQGDTVSYYQTNSHGDVSKWGTIDYSYDAFGNETTETTGANPFRYNSEYFDEETGFIYLRNRYYNPTNGRFTTEDPAKDGLNWYAYCANNPVMFVDPSGETVFPFFIIPDDSERLYAKKTYTYDRNKAVSYARTWAESYNPAYPNYNNKGGDCTNFVSQCLVAGGLPSGYPWNIYNFPFFGMIATDAWANAQENYNYFSNYKNGFCNGKYYINTKSDVASVANSGKVNIGDIMYFKSNSLEKITHAAIITKVENGEIYYCQHSSSPYKDNALAQVRFGKNETIGYTIIIVTIKNQGDGNDANTV